MPELLPFEPRSPDWLAARRTGVTATDIVTILGLSRYDSVYSLFWRKLGQVPEVEDSDRFRLGRELEEYIATRWTEENSLAAYPGGLYRHGTRTWQMATLDRKVGPLLPGYPIELKSWADADRHSWQDGPPPQVRAQVLWQMDVMDVAVGHVGVMFLPSGEFRSYEIKHNGNCDDTDALELDDSKPLCPVCDDQELMRMEGEKFMRRLRLELSPPDPDSSAATLAAVRARFVYQPDKTVEVDPVIFKAWQAWKARKDNAETETRAYEIQLREQAGEASVYTMDGQPVARRVISDAQVKAHVRHQDYIRRIKQGDDDE